MAARLRASKRAQRRAFPALVAAACAITQRDPERLSSALASVAPDAMLRMADRHRCLGYLFWGISTTHASDPTRGWLTKQLKMYCKRAALQAFTIKRQLTSLVDILNGARIPCVLLKGAARIHAAHQGAHLNTLQDLDVLLREQDIEAAVGALLGAGYSHRYSRQVLQNYRNTHHHFAPLEPPDTGVSVELHIALAEPGTLSMPTDWNALEPYFSRINGVVGSALCLDPLGSALHLTIHGKGITRLYDVVLLAQSLREKPQLLESLDALICEERFQPIALKAAAALAAHVSGLSSNMSIDVERFLEWATRREDLPELIRLRSQFTDAWFINGGSLFGRATWHAMPKYLENNHLCRETFTAPFRLAGRIATSALAAFQVAPAKARGEGELPKAVVRRTS